MRHSGLFGGRYALLGRVGEGSAGAIYRVEDSVSSATLTLKILHEEDPEALRRFSSEFGALAGLEHPHLVRVHDFGRAPSIEPMNTHGEVAFFTAGFIDGERLDVFAAGRDFEAIAPALSDVASALGFLHRMGLRHGDLKPANVIVANGRATLIDLGCVAVLGERSAFFSGTPDYAAPELLEGRAGDARADLFALGKLMAHVEASAFGAFPRAARELAARLRQPRVEARPVDVEEVLEVLGAPDTAGLTRYEAPRLFGREREVEAFRVARGALASSSGLTLSTISGERGIGKSRLCRELKWETAISTKVVEVFSQERAAVAMALARAFAPEEATTEERAFMFAAAWEGTERPTVLIVDDAEALGDADVRLLRGLERLGDRGGLWLVLFTSDPSTIARFGFSSAIPQSHAVLEPIGERDVVKWVAHHGLDDLAARMFEITQGHPSLVRSLLDVEEPRRLTRTELERRASALTFEDGSDTSFDALSSDASALLLEVALRSADGAPRRDEESEARRQLTRARHIEARQGALVLQKPALGSAIVSKLSASDPELAHAMNLSLAREYEERAASTPGTRSRFEALAVHAKLRAGDVESALNATLARFTEHDAWVTVVAALLARAAELDERRSLDLAELGVRAGTFAGAAGAVRALSEREGEAGARARRVLAAVHLAEGDAPRAIELVAADHGAEARDLESRAHIKLGDHRAAQACAGLGLDATSDPELTARLEENLGVSASYLGDHAGSELHLGRALALEKTLDSPRALVRTSSYRAIGAYRRGDLAEAERLYREVLEIVERVPIPEQLARACSNLATASHQRGDIASAMVTYERGARYANALGQRDLALTLDFNASKVQLDLGVFERALSKARSTSVRAAEEANPFFEAACLAVIGEAASYLDRRDESARAFSSARSVFSSLGLLREAIEVAIEEGEAALRSGETDTATRIAAELSTPSADEAEPSDLRARRAHFEAKLHLRRGAIGDAEARIESARSAAVTSGQRDLLAEVMATASTIANAAGAIERADRLAEAARDTWNSLAGDMRTELASVFLAHPKRQLPMREVPKRETPRREGSAEARLEKLERLVSVFRRLVSSTDVTSILSTTLDTAIDLIGAERGFVILREGEELNVAVARNVDREKVGKSHLKFSRGIAERVIEEESAIITFDAQGDDRFRGSESVFAMRLRSVVAVPIRAPDRVLGAFYLDNRFSVARFDPADVDLLQSFADQAALAVENARLVESLKKRTRELEEERARVVMAMQGQEAEIGRLRSDLRTRQEVLEHRYDYSAIIGKSAALEKVFATLDRVIETPLPVLVLGESGTGKELVARAIHFSSPRRAAPFVGINCAAIPASLIESELFGHVKGAFTGADRDREGLMAKARGGTLFLDELGELPLEVQAKLLRALQDKEVRPLGGAAIVPVDFRLVCATNRVLVDEVKAGRFREDLYYRISVVEVPLPALRDRIDDLPALTDHIMTRVAGELSRTRPKLTNAALRALIAHDWPGNVRELENVITKAVLLCDDDEVRGSDLHLPKAAPPRGVTSTAARKPRHHVTSKDLREALSRASGNVVLAARLLGVSRATFYRKLGQDEKRR